MREFERSRDARSSPSEDLVGNRVSLEATRRLLQDLHVHQVELEAQNEELRSTQYRLEVAGAQYCDLYESAPIGYFTLNEAGVIQAANRTATELLRLPKSSLIGQPLTRFILPSDHGSYYLHRRRLASDQRQVCELRVLAGDLEPRWVQLEEVAKRDDSGVLGSRAVLSDISARKRAEETLKASEERHRILFEKSHDALVTLAPPDWQLMSANSTALALFGLSSNLDLGSRSFGEYSPPRQPDGSTSIEKAAAMLDSAMREGSRYYEWMFKDLRDREFPATVLLTRIEIEGAPLLQATVRDETEMKKLHAMVRQQDRLASMGMLAASVAHEINNPLASVLYNIETLTQDLPRLEGAVRRSLQAHGAQPAGEDAALLDHVALQDISERARNALEGALRIKVIAKGISTFARMESVGLSQVDVNQAIKCAARMALNDIKFRAQLVLDLTELPTVWASEGKLSQVFLNLLINAGQAIGEGDAQGNQIRIHTWLEAERVFAEVADTGSGIAKKDLERIFDPFFTTKPVGVGSGLGLSICRNIVSELGGTMWAESEPGKGTRFIVRLPAGTEPAQVATCAAQAKGTASVSSARGRILVVDDEDPIREIILRVLEPQHEVVAVSSATAAQTIVECDPAFDVILCDLMMPGMTGMELHAWLLEHHPVLAERVVFVTGGMFSEEVFRYVAGVSNPWLDKPFDVPQLQETVAHFVTVARSKGARAGLH